MTKVDDSSYTLLSESGPDYLACVNGFNNEGICTNEKCRAFGEWVVIPKGMGEFNVIEEDHENKCPACGKYVKGEQCGFNNCSFKVIGKKFEEGKKVEAVNGDW